MDSVMILKIRTFSAFYTVLTQRKTCPEKLVKSKMEGSKAKKITFFSQSYAILMKNLTLFGRSVCSIILFILPIVAAILMGVMYLEFEKGDREISGQDYIRYSEVLGHCYGYSPYYFGFWNILQGSEYSGVNIGEHNYLNNTGKGSNINIP